jgi:hypothetical protein
MLPTVLFIVTVLLAQNSAETPVPPLEALTGNCTIAVQSLGQFVPIGRTEGLWLACGGQRFRLAHPDNLLGHVKITSAAQALEFVRLFSAKPTVSLVHTGGCVEITNRPGDRLFYGLAPAIFAKHFKSPTAEAQASKRAGNSSFVTTRVVVCPDQSVYELTEGVYEDGMYFQMSKKLVLRRARAVGIVHWPADH